MPRRRKSGGRKLGDMGKRLSRRRLYVRPLRQNFLIVCEGERTEPNYFKSFRVPKDVRVQVIGEGYNTCRLVERAIDLKQEGKYDQVWVVFDRDEFPAQHFNEAIALAGRNDIGVAYSNEAFEIWYLLHFYYHDVATSRQLYKQMLTKRLGFEYQKNASDMYEHLLMKQADAIRNAERLLQTYTPHRPADDNPCTTVHRLVEALNEFAV